MDTAQSLPAESGIVIQMPQRFSAQAVEKLAAELKVFKGGQKESAVSKHVASTLTHFCEQDERFAEVVFKTPRTLSDCCAEIMAGSGNHISDIDVYRGAVKSYFPNAEVVFRMEIHLEGDAPTDEEIQRPPKIKKRLRFSADCSISFWSLTMLMAVTAASSPLLPCSPPARARACSMVSVVRTPKAMGIFHAIWSCMMPCVAPLQMKSKWRVSP